MFYLIPALEVWRSCCCWWWWGRGIFSSPLSC